MKNIFKIAALALALSGPFVMTETALAQSINITKKVNDPVTGLAPAEWLAMIGQYIQPEAIVGKPEVIMINATPDSLTVSCDKWIIVGPKVYKSVEGNPRSLKPFSITPINTNEFDGYCKNGVTGTPSFGTTVIGRLNDANGNFTNATVVTFIRQ